MSSKALNLLTVVVGSDMSKVLTGLDQVGMRADKLGKSMQKLGGSLSKNVTAPLAAAGAAALAAGVRMGNAADQLLDLEQQTGLSTDALQEFRRVATVAGVDQDTMGKAAEQLTMRMARGAEGSRDMRDALKQLGIAATDAAGNVRPMDDVVNEAVAGLAGMEDVTQRNILATKLFSGAAKDIAPILGMGADEIERLRAEAHDMGLVIGRDALNAANDFRIQIDTLTESMQAQVSQIGLAVIPIMSELVEVVQDRVVPMIQDAVKWFGDLDRRTVMVAASIAALAASIGPMLLVGGKMIAVLGLIASPAGLVVAALAAIATATAVVAKNWDVLALQATLAWTAVKDAVFTAISGILGMMEKLPLVGAKITELKDKFDEFANDSLAGANDRILELEGRISANGAAMGTYRAEVETTTTAVASLGGALRIANVEFREMSVALPGIAEGFEMIAPSVVTALRTVEDAVEGVSQFGLAVGDVTMQGVDAFVSFASGAGDAIGNFVRSALKQLATLMAKMLAVKAIMTFLPGVGSFMGLGGKFAGGFATGGHIPAGQFGLVAEAGRPEMVSSPSFVAGPANVTPMGEGGDNVFAVTFVTPDGRHVSDTHTYRAKRGEALNRVIRLPVQVATG